MASKNKGSREIRKPKQEKKPKGAATMGTIMPNAGKPAGK